MPKRRVTKNGDKVDPAALAVLEVTAFQNILQRGGVLPRSWRSRKTTPEFTGEWLGRSAILALALYEQIIRAAMAPNARAIEKQLAVKVAENVLDRVNGKPTERIQHAGNVAIHFGGLNPDLLPDHRKDGLSDSDRIPKPVPLLPLVERSPTSRIGGPLAPNDPGNGGDAPR